MEKWAAGEEYPVWFRDRGSEERRCRGRIVVEDLSEIAVNLISRRGENGPQSPNTQYLLQQAARHLEEELTTAGGFGSQTGVPELLSHLVGGEPFFENVLQVSRHQMQRRWSSTPEWYADLIAYALRPQRYEQNAHDVAALVQGLFTQPLRVVVRGMADWEMQSSAESHVFRLGETLMTMWPDYPPVARARRHYHQVVQESWAPLYTEILHRYGLAVRPGVGLSEACWVFQALVIREGQEKRAWPEAPRTIDPIDGQEVSLSARAVMLYLAGTCLDAATGQTLAIEELYRREPVAS